MRLRIAAALVIVFLAANLHAAGPTKVVLASDEKTQVTVPESWTDLELNDNAEIEVGNEEDEAYLIVLNELKEDLYGWNLDKHSRVTLGTLLATLSFPTVTGPKPIKVGSSPAVQYEVKGAMQGRNIIYIHTTVDGPKYFSQILAWTLPSKADATKPQLLEAVNTFREK
jgi:hypothetical protein